MLKKDIKSTIDIISNFIQDEFCDKINIKKKAYNKTKKRMIKTGIDWNFEGYKEEAHFFICGAFESFEFIRDFLETVKMSMAFEE